MLCRATYPLCRRSFGSRTSSPSSFEEGQQVCVHSIGVGDAHAMWSTCIFLQARVWQDLNRTPGGDVDRNDLIVITLQEQRFHDRSFNGIEPGQHSLILYRQVLVGLRDIGNMTIEFSYQCQELVLVRSRKSCPSFEWERCGREVSRPTRPGKNCGHFPESRVRFPP